MAYPTTDAGQELVMSADRKPNHLIEPFLKKQGLHQIPQRMAAKTNRKKNRFVVLYSKKTTSGREKREPRGRPSYELESKKKKTTPEYGGKLKKKNQMFALAEPHQSCYYWDTPSKGGRKLEQ